MYTSMHTNTTNDSPATRHTSTMLHKPRHSAQLRLHSPACIRPVKAFASGPIYQKPANNEAQQQPPIC